MATITLTFTAPDATAAKYIDAYVRQLGWTPESTLTKLQFFRQAVRGHFVGTAREYLTREAVKTAGASADLESQGVTADVTQT